LQVVEVQSLSLKHPHCIAPGGPTHRLPVGLPAQWLSLPHSQLPPPHAGATVHAPATQLVAHWMPPAPHAPSCVPGAHVELTQQPPLHVVLTPSQLLVHWCTLVLHAWLAGHAAEAVHPQVPPKQPCEAPHAEQVPPSLPHADVPAPATQAPAEQQPPLHGAEALHALEHVPPLHASPAGQSLVALQPHAPPGLHTRPAVDVVQSAFVEHPHVCLMHWLLPVHALHAAPFVPHEALVVPLSHVWDEVQQPVGQLAGVHCAPPSPGASTLGPSARASGGELAASGDVAASSASAAGAPSGGIDASCPTYGSSNPTMASHPIHAVTAAAAATSHPAQRSTTALITTPPRS
jgi:hypothetical protein